MLSMSVPFPFGIKFVTHIFSVFTRVKYCINERLLMGINDKSIINWPIIRLKDELIVNSIWYFKNNVNRSLESFEKEDRINLVTNLHTEIAHLFLLAAGSTWVVWWLLSTYVLFQLPKITAPSVSTNCWVSTTSGTRFGFSRAVFGTWKLRNENTLQRTNL